MLSSFLNAYKQKKPRTFQTSTTSINGIAPMGGNQSGGVQPMQGLPKLNLRPSTGTVTTGSMQPQAETTTPGTRAYDIDRRDLYSKAVKALGLPAEVFDTDSEFNKEPQRNDLLQRAAAIDPVTFADYVPSESQVITSQNAATTTGQNASADATTQATTDAEQRLSDTGMTNRVNDLYGTTEDMINTAPYDVEAIKGATRETTQAGISSAVQSAQAMLAKNGLIDTGTAAEIMAGIGWMNATQLAGKLAELDVAAGKDARTAKENAVALANDLITQQGNIAKYWDDKAETALNSGDIDGYVTAKSQGYQAAGITFTPEDEAALREKLTIPDYTTADNASQYIYGALGSGNGKQYTDLFNVAVGGSATEIETAFASYDSGQTLSNGDKLYQIGGILVTLDDFVTAYNMATIASEAGVQAEEGGTPDITPSYTNKDASNWMSAYASYAVKAAQKREKPMNMFDWIEQNYGSDAAEYMRNGPQK